MRRSQAPANYLLRRAHTIAKTATVQTKLPNSGASVEFAAEVNLFAFQIPKSDPSTTESPLKFPLSQSSDDLNLLAFQMPKSVPST